MYRNLAALVSGFIFAIGLVVGGMTDPNKVVAFLDFFGDWDPSLAFVMGGAILLYAPVSRLMRARRRPVFDMQFHLPTRRDIDVPLIVGSLLFGLGWGLGGFCPGPALVSTMSLHSDALIFAASMITGMLAYSGWTRLRAGRS